MRLARSCQILAFAGAALVLSAPTVAVAAGVADWNNGVATIATCSNTGGIAATFQCGSVSASVPSTSCTWDSTGPNPLSTCRVTLTGSLHGTYSETSQSVNGVTHIHQHCTKSAGANDGGGLLTLQPLDGFSPSETFNVAFNIGQPADDDLIVVNPSTTSLATPTETGENVATAGTVYYAGTLDDNGTVLEVTGSFQFSCLPASSSSPSFTGTVETV